MTKLDDTLRTQIVDAIVDFPPEMAGNIPAVMADLKSRFPTVTEGDIFGCFEEAIDALEERGNKNQREADALASLAPLFDGFPEGTPLGECARIKAERGDPLAIAYLEWEKQQAGGVQ